jgi:head-tail adaptor
MMTDAERDALRADFAELMPDTVVIQRATRGTNTYGYGGSVTWSAVGTVAARVDPVSQSARREMIGDKETTVIYRQLTLPYDADIAAGDRIVYGARTYELRLLDDDHSLRADRRAEMVATK